MRLRFKCSRKENSKNFYVLAEDVSCEASFSGMLVLQKKGKVTRRFRERKTWSIYFIFLLGESTLTMYSE